MKKSLVLLVLFLVVNLSFSQSKSTDKGSKVDKSTVEREKEIEKIEEILKLNKDHLLKGVDFNFRRLDFNFKMVEKGIAKIKEGNEEFLKYITYDNLRIFVRGLMIVGGNQYPPLGVLTSGTYEELVTKSFLGGLRNKDPRIRLFSVNILKSFSPDLAMIKKIMKYIKMETDFDTNHHYFDIDLNVHLGNIKIEMLIMSKHVRRRELKKIIFDNSKTHPSIFIRISKETFVILADRISDEPERDIPLNSFKEDKINFFIAGLLNRDVYIKERCAEFIYQIYYTKGTSNETKERINKLRSDPFTFEKEAIKEKYRVEFLLEKKEYPMLPNEGSFMLKKVFETKDSKK
ncbi:MAG: hypothetical protein OEV44_08885 [Spirochaetota bacterium]|nr:hypothetical protein [Spirochaetota bacterium]